MIDINYTLKLSDENEYLVVSKALYNNKNYYYLADTKNNGNLKFCYLDNDEIVEINDNKLIKILVPLFIDNYNIK